MKAFFASNAINSPAGNHARYQELRASLKIRAIAHNLLGCALMLFIMLVGAVALLVPGLAFGQQSPAMQTWQQNISNTVPPQSGCYEAVYPNTQWQPVACTQSQNQGAPTALPPPADGTGIGSSAPAGASAPIGNGTDYAAIATPGSTISSVVGSFVNVVGVNSISSGGGGKPTWANTYSLQINTNQFDFTDGNLCKNSTSTCKGWQQFIYSNDSSSQGSVHMQYWILSGTTSCPASWYTYRGNGTTQCYTDTGPVSLTPAIAPSNLGNITLTGKTVNGTDAAIININGRAYAATRSTIFKALPQKWTVAEFNIFGYYSDYPTAIFNAGSKMTVKTAINNGTVNAPVCSSQAGGQTFEGNNLYFNSPCCPYGGTNPLIAFVEGTGSGETTTCAALSTALGLSTPTPTYYTVTANANPSGTATFSPSSAKVIAGTTVEFTMTQKDGYGMTDAAYINGTSCPLTILGGSGNVWKFRLGPINSNCDFEGYFGTPQTPTYVLSALASPSNLATFSPASVRVAAGTTVLFTMTQQAGHGMTSGLYTTGTGTTCPMTTLGGSGNVYKFKIGPVSGNCTFQGYFK